MSNPPQSVSRGNVFLERFLIIQIHNRSVVREQNRVLYVHTAFYLESLVMAFNLFPLVIVPIFIHFGILKFHFVPVNHVRPHVGNTPSNITVESVNDVGCARHRCSINIHIWTHQLSLIPDGRQAQSKVRVIS